MTSIEPLVVLRPGHLRDDLVKLLPTVNDLIRTI